MGRVGLADEVTQAALWLASDVARWVHGTTIDVAGGRALTPATLKRGNIRVETSGFTTEASRID